MKRRISFFAVFIAICLAAACLAVLPRLGGCLAHSEQTDIDNHNEKAISTDHGNAPEYDPYRAAFEKLTEFGFELDESMIAREDFSVFYDIEGFPEEYKEAFRAMYTSKEYIMYQTLLNLGFGKYSYLTGNWKPTSSQVYSFDAEVFDVKRMYKLFLKGVDAIVPEVRFTNIKEDLLEMTAEMTPLNEAELIYTDGRRSVSFKCNGHQYSVTLVSYGDWIDEYTILEYTNSVLRQEGCSKRLYSVTQPEDQLVILIYDTPERAEKLQKMINYLQPGGI